MSNRPSQILDAICLRLTGHPKLGAVATIASGALTSVGVLELGNGRLLAGGAMTTVGICLGGAGGAMQGPQIR